LSVIVPCYNEAESIHQLASELAPLRAALAHQYQLELILVDDGSTDTTWERLHLLVESFGDPQNTRLIRHATNRGLAAAIATGLAQARAEICATLDADCTYDPLQLVPMLKLLEPDVDLVVASPYHPRGAVVGVSRWRLALSRMASRMYRCVMRTRLQTYTSCVRVYRRSSVVDLPQTHGGFVGIVELVWELDRRGGKIVECPAVLTTRKKGRSKMRVARTAALHLRFLAHAAWQRLVAVQPPPIRAMQTSTA
jgi:dolichol-phosphate mannosyltransferase